MRQISTNSLQLKVNCRFTHYVLADQNRKEVNLASTSGSRGYIMHGPWLSEPSGIKRVCCLGLSDTNLFTRLLLNLSLVAVMYEHNHKPSTSLSPSCISGRCVAVRTAFPPKLVPGENKKRKTSSRSPSYLLRHHYFLPECTPLRVA